MRRPIATSISNPALIIPNPPKNIRTVITNWPNDVQYVLVETTTRPVTHTAEVAVNSALMIDTCSSCVVEIGRLRRRVPNRIKITKERENETNAEN